MKDKHNMRHSQLRFTGIISLLVFLLLPSGAAASASPCIAYAYTESGSHLFLVGENSSNFGNELNVRSNCENLSLYVNGEFKARSSNGNIFFKLNNSLQNITLSTDNGEFNATYSNVNFYPDRLEWEGEWFRFNSLDIVLIDAAKAEIQENWASFLSVIIAWILSTYVYWNLINSYVQKNFIEEVIS